MAGEALTQILEEQGLEDVAGYRFRELAFTAALVIPKGDAVEMIFRIRPTTGTRDSRENYEVRAASQADGKWVENFRAFVYPEAHPAGLCPHWLRLGCSDNSCSVNGQVES